MSSADFIECRENFIQVSVHGATQSNAGVGNFLSLLQDFKENGLLNVHTDECKESFFFYKDVFIIDAMLIDDVSATKSVCAEIGAAMSF